MCEDRQAVTPSSWFRQLQRFDWLLMLVVFVLLTFGLATITSVELSRGADEFIFVRKQVIALGLGLLLFGLAASVNYQLFRAYSRLLYWLSMTLLVGVLFFGQTLNGTTGWFIFAGLSFQPVELMKFAMVLELARYFSDLANIRFGWHELLHSGLRTALPVFLVLLQPDLGGALILVGIWLVTVFVAGIRLSHIAMILLCLASAVGVLWWSGQIQDYQLERVTAFLHPAVAPLAEGYNVAQARIAIGAGGIFGRGLGAGSQSQLRFLPESQTDFIFAVIAEELGLIGVLLLLGAFALLCLRLLKAVRVMRDAFAAYLLLGIFATFFVQTTLHVGVNLSLLPATGVTLPLVSYGGSSLVIMLLMLGVAQSVFRRIDPVDKLAKSH